MHTLWGLFLSLVSNHSNNEAELNKVKLTRDDKFLVIASDGVWEFMTNKEVVRIVWPFYDKNQPEAAANKLVKEAFGRWK